MIEQTYEIRDAAGKNQRMVTLAQFRAELDERKAMAAKVMDAVRKGDLKACSEAQVAMRKRFA